jgi:MFS family permease
MTIHFSHEARLLLKISFLVTFAESMLVPMYVVFAERVGGSLLDAGIAYALFSIATGLVVGVVGTRDVFVRHTRRFLIAGFLGSFVCDIVYIFVANKWQLFGVEIVAGLASGVIEPAWDSLFSDDINEASAKHWSIWSGGVHILGGVAALVGGAIISFASFPVLFCIMAGIDLMALLLTWRGRLSDASHPPGETSSSPAALSATAMDEGG